MNQLKSLWGLWILIAICGLDAKAQPDRPVPEIRVGIDAGDLRGNDHRALQAAVDYIAGLGGGTVHIGPGRYLMRNALILRSNVHVKGVPGKTILATCDGVKVRLASDGDCNDHHIILEDARGFRVGDGVVVQDERHGWGYKVTTATLTRRIDEKTFRLSAPLYLDYMVQLKASAALTFPGVGGWNIKDATVEGVTIEGNRKNSKQFVDGCRAGGIFLHECDRVTIRNCTVRDYNGDGIVCGVSRNVTVEDCMSEGNAGHGLHPGSGSQAPVFRRNKVAGNGLDGLFVCWRVKNGKFENNELKGNQRDGISIGHKDTDNFFRANNIVNNAKAGIRFRAETEPMGAHRNVFEENTILDNVENCIVMSGVHHDVVFRKNRVGYSEGPARGVGIVTEFGLVRLRLKLEDNEFRNLQADGKEPAD